tara:strand:+ start:229 stop:876 length:648 start_codon:yes stop_codon:yes gene_type:complete
MSSFLCSDDEEHIAPTENMKLETKSTPKPRAKKSKGEDATPRVDKRSVKDEKSRQEMLERLEKARVKALEVRMKNKLQREQDALQEKEKVEKVTTFLKNDDLFEKKYADKFERITDVLANVEAHLSEVKEIKKKKQAHRDEELAQKQRALTMAKQELDLIHEAELKVKDADKKAKEKVEAKKIDAIIVKNVTSVPITSLPNYRGMSFGRKVRGHY